MTYASVLPEAFRIREAPPGVPGRQEVLEAERQGVHAELPQGRSQGPRHHQGHVLGHTHPGGGRGMEGQGDLRMVRRGHRIPQHDHRPLQGHRAARLLEDLLGESCRKLCVVRNHMRKWRLNLDRLRQERRLKKTDRCAASRRDQGSSASLHFVI